nr:MAG TPA: hypothetical protein [Caudoviricetes sp.]
MPLLRAIRRWRPRQTAKQKKIGLQQTQPES